MSIQSSTRTSVTARVLALSLEVGSPSRSHAQTPGLHATPPHHCSQVGARVVARVRRTEAGWDTPGWYPATVIAVDETSYALLYDVAHGDFNAPVPAMVDFSVPRMSGTAHIRALTGARDARVAQDTWSSIESQVCCV